MALPRLAALGRIALHAGALVAGGAAWAVVGTNQAGKSTLMHACHLAGVPVLTDDVLVIEGPLAFAGPRCLDLRTPAAGAEIVRGGRHRVTLPPVAAAVALGGFVHLAWEDGPSAPAAVRRLDPAERLTRLADAGRGDDVWRGDVELLDLAARPAIELRRSRSGDPSAAAATLFTALETNRSRC